jgi:SAM-dependent methyltransferase
MYRIKNWARRFLPVVSDSDEKIVQQSQAYWQNQNSENFESNSHWHGSGPFVSGELWDQLGRVHLELFEKAADWAIGAASNRDSFNRPMNRVVEWGCGGGMNAVHFALRTERYIGVDISKASLDECAKQVLEKTGKSIEPVLITASQPEAVHRFIADGIDLYLSTYVFELVPSPSYGLRLLKVAFDLLRPGGLALIQIRYNQGEMVQFSKRRNYVNNLAVMTSYSIDEFWVEAMEIGFKPLFVTLSPKKTEIDGIGRYAYFAMLK